MIKFFVFAILSIYLITNPSIADCQSDSINTPLASPISSPKPQKEKIINNEVVQWELEMAENGYNLNKNVKNKSRLLKVYEQVVSLRCMTKLHEDLSYIRDPTDKICLEYIEKTLSIDSANPIAICGRDGIDSQTCKDASDGQNLQTYDSKFEERTGIASLDEVIANRREAPALAAETNKLLKDVDKLRSTSLRTKKSLDTSKIYSNLVKILTLNCKGSRIRLDEKDQDLKLQRTVATATPQIAASDNQSLITESDRLQVPKPKESSVPRDPYLGIFSGTEPKNPPTLSQSKRIYEISQQCNQYINMTRELSPKMALPICYRYGFYTYTCINAKRKEQREGISSNKINHSNENSNSSGFDVF